MKVADKGADLEKGADGMIKLARGFTSLSKISSSNDFKMHPDAIKNLNSFSAAMNRFARGEYTTLTSGGGMFSGLETKTAEDKLGPINTVAEAFNNLADSMDNVSESAKNLSAANIGSGIELYANGSAANMGAPVIINQISNSTSNLTKTDTTVIGLEAEGAVLAQSATNTN